MSKILTNLIKTDSAKGKKILVSNSKNYAKEYYKKNKIAKLEEELRKHNFTNGYAIKKRGLEYLERIPRSIKKDDIGEIALKWLKYIGLINQKQITEANQKRWSYIYYKIKNKNYFKEYKIKNKKRLKQYRIKKKISGLEEELRKHNLTDEEIIKARGFYYLKRISEIKEKDEVGELTLKWLKCKGLIDQKQIRKSKQKIYDYNYKIKNKNYFKEHYIKNKIAELEKILNNYGLIDRKSIETKGFDYLNKIPEIKEKDEVGELTLKWLRYKGLVDQKEIRNARRKRNAHFYYKKKSSERTLEEKTNELQADDYDKNESYKSLIEMIDVGVKGKRDKKEIKNFIIETLTKNGYKYIHSKEDIINVKRSLVKYMGNFENLENALSKKAEEEYSKICSGNLIVKESDKQVMSFLKVYYTDTAIEKAILSGKVRIMQNVYHELLVWINSKIKNKGYYNENSLEKRSKIEEPVSIESIMKLLDKGADLKLYKKNQIISVLNECVPKEEYVSVIVEEIKKELS